ncbi:MAG TPA: trigger factor [Firmicutes bacterium]|nr:trigger factor [Bacillota bacterium]
MKVEVERLEGCKAKINVEIEPERFEDSLNKAYVVLNRRTAVPGFRRGKTPREILFRHLGKDTVYSEASRLLVSDSFDKAIEESKLKVWGEPSIEIVEAEEGKPFKFAVTTELQPEVKLGDYKSIAVAREIPTVTPEEVEQQLKFLQETQAELVSVKDLPLKEGLYAVLDIMGQAPSEDGKSVDAISWDGAMLRIGAQTLLPGLDDKILGMIRGEEREVELDIPAGYSDKRIAGRKIRINVKVKDIKQKKVPPLDDQLAKSVGNYGSLAELREDMEKKIRAFKEEEAAEKQKEKVLDELVNRCEVQLPKGMVLRKRDAILSKLLRRLEEKRIPLEAYLRMTGLTAEDLKKEAMEEAEKQVKRDAVLRAVAEEEGTEVSEEEVDKVIEASTAGLKEKDAVKLKQLFANKSNREELREDLKVTKVVEYLVGLAAENAAKTATQEAQPDVGESGGSD